jgi:hypothetical protein
MSMKRVASALLGLIAVGACAVACSGSSTDGNGAGGASSGGADSGGSGAAAGTPDGGVSVTPSPVVISAKTRTPVTTTRSINYWMWTPTYGDDIAGTETQIAPLGLELMRIGGYNNDANTPDPFDDAQVDQAVAYASAIGAEPLLQVPLIADEQGMPPTADTAAAMVKYANVTKKYGIKYFSIGNEPDLYSSAGNPIDNNSPAIPNYQPENFCASATAYVAAMKSVDPSIQIVGPDLAYKYSPGNDWLSPILQQCGDLFDIVAIHRYPFAAAMATLPAAQADVTAFRSTVSSVRALMQAAGQGDKPLAFTEMNIDYDALPATNIPAAVAGSVPSALWVADILGAAQELGLRSTTLWDISDDDGRQFGLIGVPPAHTPRPQYYTYQLFAQHSGPTFLTLTTAPTGVHVYPTRNAADDTTQAIVVNWGTAAQVLEFSVTDLDSTPAPVTFTLPGLSIAAVDIPDNGTATAQTYGFPQHAAGTGPVTLAPGVGPLGDTDAGAPTNDADAGGACAQVKLMSSAVTSMGTATGNTLTFGPAGSEWVSFDYAGSGQTAPTLSVTADGNGFEMQAALAAPLSGSNNFSGYGMYFNSSSCLDASASTGIQFDLSGDLGGCSLRYILFFAGDLSHIDDPGRGHCQDTDSVCLGPWAPVTASAGTIRIPFSSLSNGAPSSSVDATSLVTMQWQLGATDATAGCSADFTVENVSFY